MAHSLPPTGEPPERSTSALKLLVLWLFVAFCGTIYLGFQRPEKEGVADVIQIAERLAVVARYAPDLPEDARNQLQQSAAEIETDEVAKKLIQGEPPPEDILEELTPVYRLIAEDLMGSDPAAEGELVKLAEEGLTRFTLTGFLLAGLGLCTLLSFMLPYGGEQSQAEAPSKLSSTAVLGLFFAWHVFGFVLVGLFVSVATSWMDPFFLMLSAQGLIYLFMLALFSQSWSESYALPFKKFKASWVGKGYLLSIVTVLAMNVITSSITGETPRSENPVLALFQGAPLWKYVLLGLLVVVVGPFFEELMFRGWVYAGLKKSWGERPAMFVSAALFAAIHGDAPALPALFALGYIFAWVYRRSGSLWASVLVHGMWNATTFSMLLSVMP